MYNFVSRIITVIFSIIAYVRKCSTSNTETPASLMSLFAISNRTNPCTSYPAFHLGIHQTHGSNTATGFVIYVLISPSNRTVEDRLPSYRRPRVCHLSPRFTITSNRPDALPKLWPVDCFRGLNRVNIRTMYL